MRYDVFGDIHGEFEKLTRLLNRLGYRLQAGVWQHADRQAVFVGDFIDLGPGGLEVVRTVRDMVRTGHALAVMGNHELNAIAWHTPHPTEPGEFLRPRHSARWGAKNRKQHQAFLAQVEHDPALHAEIVDWFLSLPLWLDLPEIRVVHACWHQPMMDWLSPRLRDGRLLDRELMVYATDEPANEAEKDSPEPSIFKAVEALTKGIEVALPDPFSFVDKHGIARHRVRARWWNAEAATYRDMAHLADAERGALPDLAIPEKARLVVPEDKPIFFGHYWMTGNPSPLRPFAACVDYSAGASGPLVAYRWDGPGALSQGSFISSS
ncbi:MAG: metallophosphoesterase [Burkholderiales bacterium]|nr:metallophosphoesterase [Burkholderiales bacterium]